MTDSKFMKVNIMRSIVKKRENSPEELIYELKLESLCALFNIFNIVPALLITGLPEPNPYSQCSKLFHCGSDQIK